MVSLCENKDGLARLQDKQAALQAIVRVMAGSVQLDVLPVFEETLAQVTAALRAPMAALHLLGGEDEQLTLVQHQGLDPVMSRTWVRLNLDGDTPPALAHRTGHGQEFEARETVPGMGAVVTAPVRGADIGLGALSVMWGGEADRLEPDEERLPFLETVGHLLGLAIEHAGLVAELVDRVNELRQIKEQEERRALELAELNQRLQRANVRLEELSITDELTGLFNRRHFIQRLDEEIARSRRQKHPISLIMADLDHFKRINDTMGHQVGDEALKHFADWIKGGVRRMDLVGRYGGEEFVVLLVDCGPKRALMVADKLRREVARRSQVPPFDRLGGFTVSMGVSKLTDDDCAQSLIGRADQALYKAKEGGRNQAALA